MKKLTLEQKALRVVECVVSDDVSEDFELKDALNRPFTQEDSRLMAKKLCLIYRITHSSIPTHICFSVHDDWRQEALKLYKKLHKLGE